MQILIVDDSAVDLELVRRAVRSVLPDAVLETYDTSTEALRALYDHGDRVDLVVTDAIMPRMTGADVANAARCPVVMVTGVPGLAPGGMIVIEKSADLDVLVDRFRRAHIGGAAA